MTAGTNALMVCRLLGWTPHSSRDVLLLIAAPQQQCVLILGTEDPSGADSSLLPMQALLMV